MGEMQNTIRCATRRCAHQSQSCGAFQGLLPRAPHTGTVLPPLRAELSPPGGGDGVQGFA